MARGKFKHTRKAGSVLNNPFLSRGISRVTRKLFGKYRVMKKSQLRGMKRVSRKRKLEGFVRKISGHMTQCSDVRMIRQPKWMKGWEKIVGDMNYYTNGIQKAYANGGSQCITETIFCTANDLRKFANNPTTVDKEQQSYLKEFTVNQMYTNITECSQRLAVYLIEPRRDMAASSSVYGPLTDWDAGLVNEGASAGGSAFVNATPFKSREFTTKYVVRKVWHVNMEPGDCHKVYIKRRLYKPIRPYVLDGLGANLAGTDPFPASLKGYTFWLLAVAIGVPSTISSNGTVTTTAPALAGVWERQGTVIVNSQMKTITTWQNNLASAVGADMSYINADNGEKVTGEEEL